MCERVYWKAGAIMFGYGRVINKLTLPRDE